MFDDLLINKNGYVSGRLRLEVRDKLATLIPSMVGKYYKKTNRKNPQIYYIVSFCPHIFRLYYTTYDNKYTTSLPLYRTRYTNQGILIFLKNLVEATEEDVQTKKLESL